MISMFDSDVVSAELLADIVSVSKATLLKWEKSGRLIPSQNSITHRKEYKVSQLIQFEEVRNMINSNWDQELNVKPAKDFSSVELFAGAGGLALGLEKAGFNAVALNELDEDACKTLQGNHSQWNVIQGDVKNVDFAKFIDVDLVSGGFPCQAFSYAGEKLGFEDTRGTLFFEFSRAVKEIRPKVFLGENVRGLLNHDNGKTLSVIKSIISDLGYTLIEPKVLKALFYRVPQKRERLFFVGIRNDLVKFAKFQWPSPYYRILVLKDALKAGELYATDVPKSEGQSYPNRKREILSYIPQGGYWRDLPDDLQREYMQGSYFLSGGKTGMARRLSWDEPSLTLTCSPAQKQTERCHPEETRPLTIREYARIQTFPDEWHFSGSVSSQYKQIGNAVPVNLAYAVGRSIIALLNSIDAEVDLGSDSLAFNGSFHSRQLTLLNT
ncbi:C-5 cytosine-specific DNA methylase [Gloeomargarita lithophora Alchichica-D10]|uniref:Cytosine-specific methyltransferase n=2 Tax=Gloeomargarita TaxID=1188227 RepID=A0A1J0AFG8_9CYAN|nr:C-5 cytosine-specific DNA methylase [Gloeomargarita lithophora Alchichica-D10]